MKIRKATKKDILEIFCIMKDNNPQYSQEQAKKEINEMFSRALVKPTYLVAEEKGKVVGCGGFIRSWADNTIFNIFWINALSEYQGKGIGTRLVREMIKTIKTIREKPPAKMITLSTNMPKFYERLGFKKLSRKYDRDYILMGMVL